MDGAFIYDALPTFDAFERVGDAHIYTALPDDWQVGVADVVRSTDALEKGRYKEVNMAGAAVVAAVRNALDGRAFPFVFGGDGAVLAVAGADSAAAREAMAATTIFVEETLGLSLRVGMIGVRAIRSAGHDLRVARYAASKEAIYAMFAGGGAGYAESELKAGRIAIASAPQGARPNLAGLSCRWSPIASRHGLILSVLVVPATGSSPDAFRRISLDVIRMAGAHGRGGHPVPPEGPRFALNARGMRLEAAATSAAGERVRRFAGIFAEMVLAVFLNAAGRALGRFDPKRYRSWVTQNSDFRKYDDALRMTIDCSAETADALEALLARAEADRIVDYGLHRQDAALMTCIVPSYVADDHLHFLDGARGGYALAAKALKERLAARAAATSGSAG